LWLACLIAQPTSRIGMSETLAPGSALDRSNAAVNLRARRVPEVRVFDAAALRAQVIV
jgi:hypothetical protein